MEEISPGWSGVALRIAEQSVCDECSSLSCFGDRRDPASRTGALEHDGVRTYFLSVEPMVGAVDYGGLWRGVEFALHCQPAVQPGEAPPLHRAPRRSVS